MEIQRDISLAPFTTFKIGGLARFFCVVKNVEEVRQAVNLAREKNLPIFVLGGGSNIIVSDEGFPGLVIHPKILGVEVVYEDQSFIHYKVGAGENWDKFVALTVEKNHWGIENLSHIPGNSGAVAVQNVGAYGQEASQVVEAVEAYDTHADQIVVLKPGDMMFAYRSSIFNSTAKGRYVILYVIFKLSKTPQPNLSYRDLQARFSPDNVSIDDIRNAVIEIRNKKFPFPVEAVNGNAGSFFKNPIFSEKEYENIRERVKENLGVEVVERMNAKVYRDGNAVKIPAAFLLDVCGLKNAQIGGAAINENQPLVIINKSGSSTAKDVIALANYVKMVVKEKTGIELAQEPELVGF